MSSFRKWTILLSCISLLLIIFTSSALATTHYITPAGAGSKNGANWSNAYNGLPASLTRGDTYVMAGGSYAGGYEFSDAESGTTLIYIRKASAALDSGVTGWQSSYETSQAVISGDYLAQWWFNTSYYSLDGGGTNANVKWATSGKGTKITTRTGSTSPGGLGIGFSVANNITIKNIEFDQSLPMGDRYTVGVGEGGYPSDNVVIQYCYFHGPSHLVRLTFGDNALIEYNYFGVNSQPLVDHSETFAFIRGSGHTIRYNLFKDTGYGTGCLITLLSGMLGPINNVKIYGNIFDNCDQGGNGVIGTGNSSDGENTDSWLIYNNTFINGSIMSFGAARKETNWVIKNNLSYGGRSGFSFQTPNAGQNFTFSNNYYNGSNGRWTTGSADVNSTETTSVLFNNYAGGDYHLGVTSQAKDAGTNLGSLYNTDPDGVTRGQEAGWDIGAYEFSPKLAPPLKLRIVQ